jgi:hypothetical protein
LKNVEIKIDGSKLTIEVNLDQEFGLSKSGKSIVIASTEGNLQLPGREEKLGLNLFKSF